MRFLPAGDQALLVELPDLTQTMQLYRALSGASLEGVREMVPAAQTILVHFYPWHTTRCSLVQSIQQVHAQLDKQQELQRGTSGTLRVIPVHYDGEDLADVAELLGLSVAQVVAQHTGHVYDAAFAGFAPGFVYLSGGANFQVPRRTTPRTRVPAGSVALGGNFSAIYPSASPGGWQLIGRTDIRMWDLAREAPAYVQPGDRVQFVDAARRVVHISLPKADISERNRLSTYVPQAQAAIELISVGLQTLVQDAGRPGLSGLGISESGALDRTAMRDANRLVGNPADTPVLENVLGQLQFKSHGPTTLAVTGARAAVTIRTAQGATWVLEGQRAFALNDGDEAHVGAPAAGVRCYVAVRGGWLVELVLGSCAMDTLAQIGPAPLQAGQHVPVGSLRQLALQCAEPWSLPPRDLPAPGDTVVLDVVPGPRTDWFAPQALDVLQTQPWTVTPQSNRIGIRLQGTQLLARSRHDELPSEGTVVGAIQVPISGQPVLFLADHPLTGGYPVIGAVASHHLDLAAQIPVGCLIRFRVLPERKDIAS
ncbi:5-oxoprolinase subunit B/C family protein [Comamonas sp.]